MASLTHVYMWTDNGWRPVTAEQAAILYPGGTVSAQSGLFMCGLCGQYVTFTKDSKDQVRHFRHSGAETDKNCPERVFGPSYQISYDPRKYNLPIRITDVCPSSFRFELGLIRAPIDTLAEDFRIEIWPEGASVAPFVFAKERLNSDSITYLPIGDQPFEKYTLNICNGSTKLYDFWPREVEGIDPNGTLFEKSSGKKLTKDADIEINREYYLLTQNWIDVIFDRGVSIHQVSRKIIEGKAWFLYEIQASTFSEAAAKFYLKYHCRLTARPVSLQPVWPLFIEGNYIVKHNQNDMYVLVEGDEATMKTFPSAKVCLLGTNASQLKLYKVACSDRQQLISAGRTQTLQYTYFWRKPLDQTRAPQEISVTDIFGTEIAPGASYTLPHNKTLCVKSPFYGEIIISKNNCVVDKQEICADKNIDLNVSYGLNIQVVIGLDVIWHIDFKKRRPVAASDETDILKRITRVSGVIIPAPHSLRNILVRMNRYPRICQWIRTCIKQGTIHEQSYRRLQEVCRRTSTNR